MENFFGNFDPGTFKGMDPLDVLGPEQDWFDEFEKEGSPFDPMERREGIILFLELTSRSSVLAKNESTDFGGHRSFF